MNISYNGITSWRLNEREPYSEKQSKRIVRQILHAVKYMHDCDVVHRDLKFQNILFEKKDSDVIKIIDFGLSTKYKDEGSEKMHKQVGTIITMAPQVFEMAYSSQCDLWSIGVIAFWLLSGENPFYDPSTDASCDDVISKIMKCDYSFKSKKWLKRSQSSRDFCTSLLTYDPKIRLNAAEALEHEWLKENNAESHTNDIVLNKLESNIQIYANYSEIKKLSMLFIAHKPGLPKDEIDLLRDVFQRFDEQKTGTISLEEFKEAMQNSSFSNDELVNMFNEIDAYDDGQISYTEFLAATLETNCNIQEERINEVFQKMDCDGTGYISKDNLKSLLGNDFTVERADRIFEELNLSETQKITFEDFLKAFRNEYQK